MRPRTGLPGVQPLLEISRGSRIAENRIKPSNFVLVPRVKNGRKKRLFLTLGTSSETRINTGFFPFLPLFLSQALGQLPRRPLSGLSPAARAPRSLVFSCAAPVEGRNFLKKVSSKTFSRLRAFGPAARTVERCVFYLRPWGNCLAVRSRGYRLRRVRPARCFFPCAARFEGRNFLKKVSSKTFSRLRAFGPAARTCVSLSIRRGFQPPPPGATCSAGAPVIRPSGSPGPKR